MEKATPKSTVIRTAHGKRLSRFVFTVNNYSDDDFENIKRLEVKWIVCGKEKGDSGTPHLQGAVIIGKQVSFSTIKTWPGLERAHIEPMRGSPQDSLDYCTKEDSNAFVKGTLPSPGKRNDVHQAVARIRAGESLQQLAADDDGAVAVVKFYRGLTVLRSIVRPRRTSPPIVHWLYGTTGTGKTRTAVELAQAYAGDDWWISSGSLRWFDGYDGQRFVIFDDLRTKHCEFSFLLRLLDRYPCTVEVKGSTIAWTPECIFVTAPDAPRVMWSLRTTEQLDQLERRVTKQWHLPDEFPTLSDLQRDGESDDDVLALSGEE